LLKGAFEMLAAERLSKLLVVILVFAAGTIAAGTYGREKRVDQLIEQLGQRDFQGAVDALAEIGEPALEPLIRILKDRSIKAWSIQARAISVLETIGTERAVGAIVDSLNDTGSNQYLRGFAATALGRTGSVKMIEPLGTGLQDEKQFVRWKCTQALGMLGHRKCVDVLFLALRDEDQDVRSAAAKALGDTRSKEAGDILISAFRDQHWLVRLNARNSMVEIGEPAIERLIEELKNRNPRVRWQAAWALGRIKSNRAVGPLTKAMGDTNRMVRDEAAVALVRIGSEKAAELLAEVSRQGTDHVRDQAAWVLAEMKRDRIVNGHERQNTPAGGITPEQISYNQETYPCYPKTLDSIPKTPSPLVTPDGVEIMTALMKDGQYALVPVTVENGRPLNYNVNRYGKGRQLAVDAVDFPTLARTGLHCEAELSRTKMIAGRSIVEIAELGRPERSSGAGFMAHDEDIVSVLKGDNRLVRELGLTHPQMARPLFHIWNMMLKDYELGRLPRFWNHVEHISYNGTNVLAKAESYKGWQESVFEDEILGRFEIDIWRELSRDERALLREKYPDLSDQQMAELIKKLSHIHTGEMVPYYIMRYGFYEGHTDYRADPIAIALIFGIKTLEQIESTFEGRLYETLTRHFIRDL
jgi:HEAT repeat protein